MTSHIRHRRGVPPPLIEAGELHVDPSNRQLIAGDIGAGAGSPLPMLAVRVFDTRSSYAVHDYATQAGSLYRSNVAIAPGPFNANQWTLVSGAPSGGGGTPGEHTPLHGYGDGFQHTLILHNSVSDNSQANSIVFNNAAGVASALMFTLGTPVDDLRIQATRDILFSQGYVNGDDTHTRVRIGADDVVITQRSAAAGGVTVQGMVNDNSRVNAFRLQNANGDINGAMWALNNPDGSLQVQSTGTINFIPQQPNIDGTGVMLQVSSTGVSVGPALVSMRQFTCHDEMYGGRGLQLAIDVPNATVNTQNGYLLLHAATDLYLRAGSTSSTVRIADTGENTVVGGPLVAGGPFTGVSGGQFQNDLTIYRASAPTTGALFLGSGGGHYLYFDGTDLQSTTQRIQTLNPTVAAHVAIKGYVDAADAVITAMFANYLPLGGGTLSGPVVTNASGSLLTAGPVPSIQVLGTLPWSAMAFHCPGVFGTNFGLNVDGNFYMGGWSHSGNSYQFWTKRDFANAPINGARWLFAGDYTTDVTSTVREPFPGGAVTGISYDQSTGQLIARYRYLQLLVGTTWTTIPIA